ncbi:Carbohydrate esterase 4 protein [Phlyctochytrium planicorne]|nr:Carbohydrate esterase 4 protein [Phlyctochytrium planicorne]KAJ3102046.1 Carbohydrate esterase 4 protein [Phlyctochytrium planicorne]
MKMVMALTVMSLSIIAVSSVNGAALLHPRAPTTCSQSNFDNCPLLPAGYRACNYGQCALIDEESWGCSNADDCGDSSKYCCGPKDTDGLRRCTKLSRTDICPKAAEGSACNYNKCAVINEESWRCDTADDCGDSSRFCCGPNDTDGIRRCTQLSRTDICKSDPQPTPTSTPGPIPTPTPGVVPKGGYCNYGTCATIEAETYACKCNSDCGTVGAFCGKPVGAAQTRVCTLKKEFWQNAPAPVDGACNACDGCAQGICDFGICRTNSQVGWGCNQNTDCGSEPAWCCSKPDPTFPGSARHCTRSFSSCPVPPKYTNWNLPSYCYALADENLGDSTNPRLARTCNKPGQMAITFDDGPYLYEGVLLETLKRNNISATFFINGVNNGNLLDNKTQQLVYSMTKDGIHEIADHTWTHPDMVLGIKTDAEMRFQVDTTFDAIYNITGWKPRFFRPPFGSFKLNTPLMQHLKDKNMINVLWSADTFDASKQQATDGVVGIDIYKRLFSGCPANETSFITLQHSTIKETGNDPSFIDQIATLGRAKGWTFVKLSECLGEAPYVNAVQGPVLQGVRV